MPNSVLMVAFHFPPAAMGSGHLRTLGFARYLPDSGWNPVVLSARALAYPHTTPLDTDSIPSGCIVRRAFALDASRHLSVAGKYPGFLAQPDRWASWWPGAVWQGLRLIRRYKVRAIWSTYPIMTAHCIAHTLSRITGLPWIADFRDPVFSSVSASNAFTVGSQQRWERRVFACATRVVFTTRGAMDSYAAHYPDALAAGRLAVIENGYDEAAFAGIAKPPPRSFRKPLTLLHSGLLYPDGRNPLPFFKALAQLKAAGRVTERDLTVILRASGSEAVYVREIIQLGLTDLVTLAPQVSNHDALAEQMAADALLLFQGREFDRQIPAKLYEYLRVGKPIFALVGPDGDTAAKLRETGGAELVSIENAAAIAKHLVSFTDALLAGQAPRAHPGVVNRCSRREGAAALAGMLASNCGTRRSVNPK